MKSSLLLSMLVIATWTNVDAQSRKKKEQDKINQTIIKLFDGLAALDDKIIKQYSTADLMLLENGELWNMDTVINELNQLKRVSFSRTNHLNFIHTEVTGKTAWVAYNNAADITINRQKMNVQWLESAFLVKKGKEWKVRLLHSTLLKPKKDSQERNNKAMSLHLHRFY